MKNRLIRAVKIQCRSLLLLLWLLRKPEARRVCHLLQKFDINFLLISIPRDDRVRIGESARGITSNEVGDVFISMRHVEESGGVAMIANRNVNNLPSLEMSALFADCLNNPLSELKRILLDLVQSIIQNDNSAVVAHDCLSLDD